MCQNCARNIPLTKPVNRKAEKSVFSYQKGNREYHMLDRSKAVAKRARFDPAKFDLKTNHDVVSDPIARSTRQPRPSDLGIGSTSHH